MNSSTALWSWSLPLFRFRGIAVAMHWSLIAIAVFQVMVNVRLGTPLWMAPLLVIIIFLSVLLHEFGHAFAARMVGGDCERIVMWMLGGLAECQVPMRPAAKFVVTACGPLVNLVLWALSAGSLMLLQPSGWHWVPAGPPGLGYELLSFTAYVNLALLLFNLVPCFPLDGGKLLLSSLWPLIGLLAAFTTVLMVSYPCAIGMLVYAAWWNISPMLMVALWILSEIIHEHIAWRTGSSLVFGIDLDYGPNRLSSFERWRERRRRRTAAKRDQEAIAEQAQVDLLLAKVGDHGLASLTKQERAVLEAYSRKQREKQEVGN